MAHITVIWYDPEQVGRARDRLNDVHEEGHLLIGVGERADAEALVSDGLVLQSYQDGPTPLFGEPVAARFTAGVRVIRDEPPVLPEEDWTSVYLTSLAGPLFSQWRAELGGSGFEVVEHLGNQLYTVRGPAGKEHALTDFDFVQAARRYTVEDTWFPVYDFSGLVAVTEPALLCDLHLHRDATPFALVDTLLSLGVPVVGEPGPTLRVLLTRTSGLVARIAAHPDVALIQEFRTGTPANDRIRGLVGVPAHAVLDGAGETIAVADSGIDATHAACAGRVTTVDMGGRGHTNDDTGHGTHVAATAAGAGRNPGIAPAAELYVQSVVDANGNFGGTNDIRRLLSDAYAAGARIHNNSWTRETGDGAYGDARVMDEVVRKYGDLVVVVAAGNEGKPARSGCLTYGSVSPPGTAKNVLCVGASRSDRTNLPTTGTPTWRSWFPLFSTDPIGRDQLSGDPQCLDARSGRGPCRAVDRIKPDLVAPGTFIRSANAGTAPAHHGWAHDANDADQVYLGGTSMAAAAVSGAAALVRQHLRALGHTPSAALIRAVLVNGAQRLTGWDATQDHGTVPNYHQGFGRLDLTASLPDPGGPASLQFLDDWGAGATTKFDEPGQQVTVSLDVGDAAALRVCLVWDDPAAQAAQNILNLHVTNDDTGETWTGNADADGHHRAAGVADSSNTVQAVHVEAPEAGRYDIAVTVAEGIVEAPQKFALAITGELLAPLSCTGPD